MNSEQKEFIQLAALGQPYIKDLLKPVNILPVPKGKRAIMRVMQMKACYANAARFVCRHDECSYVLGYAAGIIPVEHAWVTSRHGSFDPTWEKYSGIGHTYMEAIRLDFAALEQWLYEHKMMPPSLYDLYRAGHFRAYSSTDRIAAS